MNIVSLRSSFLGWCIFFALLIPMLAFRSPLPQLCQYQCGRLRSTCTSRSAPRSHLFLLGAMKNDPEWGFMDTARIHVKGGDGGKSACLSTAMHEVEEELVTLTSTSHRKRNSPVEQHKISANTSNKRRGRGKKRWKQFDKDQLKSATVITRDTPVQSSSPKIILGGKGGNGGSVYIVCNGRLESLVSLLGNVHFEAPNGEDGSMGNRDGANGSDIHIQVPSGTMIRDLHSQNLVGELVEDGDSILLAHGGNGGSKTKRKQQQQKRQQHNLDSSEGEKRWLTVEYQISADVGIVGMANSGKSSILAALSNAKPRIDAYPFTTMCPNLGVCQNKRGSSNDNSKNSSFTLCDLPGLMDGASEGAGMGGAFLRHAKNCSVLLHVVDASSENPFADFETVNRELAAFDGKSNSNGNFLQDKPQVVVLSKCDMISTERKNNLVEEFQLKQEEGNTHVLSATISNVENLDLLMKELYSFVRE